MDQLIPFVLIVVAFAVLIVLPARQRKKMAARAQEMQQALVPGTPVMLTSGIHGTVVSLGDSTIDLEIAPGVVVTVVRQAVMEVRRPAGVTPEEPATGQGPADGDPTDRTR